MRGLFTLCVWGGILSLLMIVGCLRLTAHFFGEEEHRSAKTMSQTFRSHRPGFERLVAMIREDSRKGLERVDHDWTWPENPSSIGVSIERLDEYRRLFRGLGLSRGFSAFNKGIRIELIASSQGLTSAGSSKGYVHCTHPPGLVVKDLDSYRSPDGRSFVAHQQIEGAWYMYYECED